MPEGQETSARMPAYRSQSGRRERCKYDTSAGEASESAAGGEISGAASAAVRGGVLVLRLLRPLEKPVSHLKVQQAELSERRQKVRR